MVGVYEVTNRGCLWRGRGNLFFFAIGYLTKMSLFGIVELHCIHREGGSAVMLLTRLHYSPDNGTVSETIGFFVRRSLWTFSLYAAVFL